MPVHRFGVVCTSAALLGALTLAGCSSTATAPAAKSTAARTVSATKAKSYAPPSGTDAALIAEHIPGCTGVLAGNVGGGGPYLVSTATCTLDGHLVIVNGWRGSENATITDSLAGTLVYYAHGLDWTAFLADQGAAADTTTLQEQMTNEGGALLKEGTDGDPFPPASLSAQKVLSAKIAAALGGQAAHAS